MGINHRYDIKINQATPSDAEVDEHKNFDRILSQYKRSATRKPLHQSLHKTNKMFPVVIVAILIILIVFYYERFRKPKPEKELPKTEQVGQRVSGSAPDCYAESRSDFSAQAVSSKFSPKS